MATTEIEKLERRYAENPQGLTFAPLAEVHRKNGDVTRALELLKAGLELHPNYIPASIVLGRCHWDLGDLPAAESAFSHVLRLDDENVIALKSLADINEKLERFTEAQRWLNRLISVDRSNDEARQQLARLEAARQQPRSPVPPPAEAAAPPDEPAKPEPPRVEVSVPAVEPEKAPPPAPALEFIDTSGPAGSGGTAEPKAPVSPVLPPPEEPAPLEGLVSQEFVPPRESYRSHPELTRDFVDEPASLGDAELEQLEVETAAEVELQSSGASEFRVSNAAEDFMEAAPAPAAPPSPAPDIELSLPEPAPAPPPRTPIYSASQTKGQSVAAFFAALLRARPAGTTGVADPVGVAPAGSPSGDTALSFDDLFGPSGQSSQSPKEGSDPGKEDLDQFQSWLQNLKR